MSDQLTHDLTVHHVDPDTVTEYPGNARQGDVDAIADSMDENGIFAPIVVQRSTGYVLDGNHRLKAMRLLGEPTVPVIYVDVDDDRAKRMVLVANRTNDLATYDDAALVALLQDLPDLTGTGYDDDALVGLLDGLNDVDLDPHDPDEHDNDGDTDSDYDAEDKGAGLELFGVTVGEPDVDPSTGSTWQLGDHTLVVCDVHKDWHLYTGHLTEGALLWPYPSLLAPFVTQAKDKRLVLVQPNPYLAGWTITKWQRITGRKAVEVTL